MNNKIAVFLGKDGKTISLNQNGTTKVYLKEGDEWKVIKEIIFETNDLMGSEIIRDNVKNMADHIGDCRVFVARSVKGIPYTVLDGMGFNIWKVDGAPEDFLQLVFKGEEEEELNKLKPEIIPTPIRNGKEGKYFIDMKTEMQNNPNFTSKQILLPFMKKTSFMELEIICGHVPPWFEREFNGLGLRSETEKINERTVKVRVYPKDVIGKMITKDMTIGKILKNNPEKIHVLMDFGMDCTGCLSVKFETLEKAANVHDVNLDQLIYELNN